MAAEPAHQLTVAFADDPAVPRLLCASAACLLALKNGAFGRTRPPDGALVERDYHDAYLLLSAVPDIVMADLETARHEVRRRALDAVAQLAAGGHATAAAARQMVSLGAADSQRAAEAAVSPCCIENPATDRGLIRASVETCSIGLVCGARAGLDTDPPVVSLRADRDDPGLLGPTVAEAPISAKDVPACLGGNSG